MAFSRETDSGRGPGTLTLVGGPTVIQPGAEETGLSDEARAARTRLGQLRQEHRDLDRSIEAMMTSGAVDQLQMTRMKKRKLLLRDLISKLEDEIIPDIIA